jgi:hypothetical protein
LRLARPVALAAAMLVLAPAATHAATARVEGVQASPPAPARSLVHYQAAPGEANDLTVSAVPGDPDVVELREASVRIAPGPGCTALEATAVRCDARAASQPSAGLAGVAVRLGDRADRVRGSLAGVGLELRGGPGDDELRGGPAGDFLAGGPGRDHIDAGPGDDVLAEDDEGAHAGRDLIDGGPGRDRVEYRARRTPVAVDLARGRGADGDRLRRIEDASGGRAGDVLRGDRGANELRGNGGADRLYGRRGRDVLDVGDGPGRARRDVARCGPGFDLVRDAARPDGLADDCERAQLEGRRPHRFSVLVGLPLRAGRSGVVDVRLADPGASEPFRGRVALRFRGLLLGRPSPVVALSPRGRAVAPLGIVDAALSRLTASRRLTVVVVVNDASFTTLLHAPPLVRGPGGGTPS